MTDKYIVNSSVNNMKCNVFYCKHLPQLCDSTIPVSTNFWWMICVVDTVDVQRVQLLTMSLSTLAVRLQPGICSQASNQQYSIESQPQELQVSDVCPQVCLVTRKIDPHLFFTHKFKKLPSCSHMFLSAF